MRAFIIWLAIIILAFTGLASSQEITDLFSSLESSDVTVTGDAQGSTLQIQILKDGTILQTRSFALDGPAIWVITWPSIMNAGDGNYQACAKLSRDGEAISSMCYSFLYGDIVPIRFDVRDFDADSRGIHMALSSQDPSIVDITYMLISGNKAIYAITTLSVSISGGFASASQIDEPWRQILVSGKEYSGRVKIFERSKNQTRAFMNSFVAREDATITETYEDETGASATVMGSSRVPFEGRLRFILTENGTRLEDVEKKTPVLLTGDDETVEISWNRTLNPGLYQLEIQLIGRDGQLKDLETNVIEAQPIARPQNVTAPKKSSGFPTTAAIGALAVIAAVVLFWWWKRKKSH
jgi:hypothetical protein